MIFLSTLSAFLGAFFVGLGFLSFRRKLPDISKCEEPPVKPLFYQPTTHSCWSKSSEFPRMQIVILDALRTDFVLPPIDEQEAKRGYAGRLDYFSLDTTSKDRKGLLFPFIADPPTATTQRIGSLISGSLPTFFEVTNSFSSEAFSSDNLISQLLQKDRNFCFFGDDTWLSLCPDLSSESTGKVVGYHSFHLFDLHTVDDGVKSNLARIQKEGNRCKLSISHFLGLDHCGHKLGPIHVECGDKLSEYDQVIRDRIELMGDDEILFVFGDHGMTDEGDHGGATEREISSVLFASTKEGLLPDSEFWGPIFAELEDCDEVEIPFWKEKFDDSFLRRRITQIDLTPTLSLLAGIPIPFGNLGTIIPEFFINAKLYKSSSLSLEEARLENMKILLDAIRMNAGQIIRYLMILRNDSSFSKAMVDEFSDLFTDLERSSAAKKTADFAELLELFYRYHSLTKSILTFCRDSWSRIEYRWIRIGSLISVATICLVIVSLISISKFTVSSALNIFLWISQSISLSSTSFLVFEDTATRFFLLTSIAFSCFASLDSPACFRRFALSTTCALLSRLMGACREEQYPFCEVFHHRNIPASPFNIMCYVTISSSHVWWLLIRNSAPKIDIPAVLLFSLAVISSVCTWISETSGLPLNVWTIPLENLLSGTLFIASAMGLLFFRRLGRNWRSLCTLCFASSVLRPFGLLALCTVGLPLLNVIGETFSADPTSLGISSFLCGSLLVFTTGRQYTISSINWEAAFVGIGKVDVRPLSALLLVLNSFAGHLFAFVLVSQISLAAARVYLLCGLGRMAVLSIGMTFLLRHLMIWKMFTPRFLGEMISCVVLSLLHVLCA